jgi:hypothetical protein
MDASRQFLRNSPKFIKVFSLRANAEKIGRAGGAKGVRAGG